jgi:hypothetical protein
MINDGKGGIYDHCAKCGRLVKLNKFIFGDLHICAEEEKGPEVNFTEPGTGKVLFTLPRRKVLEMGRDMLEMQHSTMIKQASQQVSVHALLKGTALGGVGLSIVKGGTDG